MAPRRLVLVRAGMALRGIAWRAGHVRRRATERGARALLRLILAVPWFRKLPRRTILAVERRLLSSVDNAHFDPAHYLACNPDVQQAGVDPLAHYLADGWAEGRNPNPGFDDPGYRRQAGLGQHVRVSALAHWHAIGRRRGLGPSPHGARRASPARSRQDEAAAAAEALGRLERIAPRLGEPEVDVIVPVYRGRAETLRCLASVLEAENETPFALVVIDDCGPDPALRADLARMARQGLIERVVQPRNRGFVAAINRGMALHGARDVVWLNSDTEVYGDWLDRLRRTARSADDIATVTPLTNNGTICSYPRFVTDNFEALEIGWSEVDHIASRVNAGRTVEAPTCVGFATYVRRDAIERVGVLDEAAFGRGYGEENDFSQRAIRAGLRNLIAGDVFVRHLGQTSFGDSRDERAEAALAVVERRHPGYVRTVHQYVAEDPPAPLRRAIDVERLKRASPGNKVLLVTHSLGGGTQQHVEEEVGRLRAAGRGAVLLTGGAGGRRTARLSHPDLADLPSLAAVPLAGPKLPELLAALGVREVQLHHLADFGPAGAGRFARLLDSLELPFDFVAHDYLSVCPRINLVDRKGMYCGERGEASCRRCLMTRRSDFGVPDIGRWRKDYGTLLGAARQVRVPDRDVAARLRRYFPTLANIAVRPHERLELPRPAPGRRRPGPVRIATIGAIGPIKGFDVLINLAAEMRAGQHAAELAVIGYTRNDAAARGAGIRVTGPYRNEEAAAEIAGADPDLIFIASTWPETYCYTLSHALESGRPVAAFDIGALGTRIRDAQARGAPCALLPLDLAGDPAALLAALLRAQEAFRPRALTRLEPGRRDQAGPERARYADSADPHGARLVTLAGE